MYTDRTKIAEPAMLWLDTYFEWINPSGCCGVSRDDDGSQCFDPTWKNDSCDICLVSSSSRPNETEFATYLDWFLKDNPGIDCPSGGHAAFGGAVKVNHSDPANKKNSTVLSKYCDTPPIPHPVSTVSCHCAQRLPVYHAMYCTHAHVTSL